MDSKLLLQAKKDIPLYLSDFTQFWSATEKYITDKDLILCYSGTIIFKNWKICLNSLKNNKLDGILDELHEDVNTSFYLSYLGQYRSSHMHMRSIIELSLQLLYFYQHEIEYNQWKEGEFRIKHEELTSYLKKHPALKYKSTVDLIDQITGKWKEFSKYIHAEAPIYFQSALTSSKTKKIDKKDWGIWKSNFTKILSNINILFLYFFKQNINSFPSNTTTFLLRNIDKTIQNELGLK